MLSFRIYFVPVASVYHGATTCVATRRVGTPHVVSLRFHPQMCLVGTGHGLSLHALHR